VKTCESSPGWALRAADAIWTGLCCGFGPFPGAGSEQAIRARTGRALARIMVRERLRGVKVVMPLFSASGAHICSDCGLRFDEHPAACESEPTLVMTCDGRLAQL
jgi:hypothetical protein